MEYQIIEKQDLTTYDFPTEKVKKIGIDLNPQNFDFVYGYPSLEELDFVNFFDITNFETEEAIGIYIHIPFCKSICNYCYFSKTTDYSNEIINKYLTTLKEEIFHYSQVLNKSKIKFCYIGGGTPSLLSINQIDYLISNLYNFLDFSECVEFTFEGCPSTLSYDKISFLKSKGINRISIGVQTFDEKMISVMNRSNNKLQSLTCIENLEKIYNSNYNIDLIYGYPLSNLNILEKDLNIIKSLSIPSVTLYQLWAKVCRTLYNKKTFTFNDILEQKLLINDFFIANSYYQDKSDWYIKSSESKFKFQDYKWHNGNFIGLGLSSYAFMKGYYYLNEKNLSNYFNRTNKIGNSISRIRKLSDHEIHIREIILGIKTLNAVKIDEVFHWTPFFRDLNNLNLIELHSDSIILTELGRMIPDNISKYLSFKINNKYTDERRYN